MAAAGPLDKIAIVGLAFRFPGPGREGFWQALCAGQDLVTQVHESRWARDAYLHPDENEPGRSYTFAAGSLGDVSGFDAAFFGISPREATDIDPQQRLLLELTWEALENGGIRPSSLRGTRSGVMVGFSGSDYGYRHAEDLDSVGGFFMTGSSASIAANRLSYFYDLRGPSFAVDTACSSALTAVHLACQSLAQGESDLAITGAANLHLHPIPFVAFSKATMLARGGRSRAFDAAGDGYVRSEGCAVLVLKRLADALADGNRILAVIAGSAVNCDGRTNGLTVPSAQAQATLLREVYARAGIAPSEIDYLEAHGTGTAVGDPIEANALGEALGRARPPGRPLRIGSIKSNLGHMETVAGMAGLVKAVYCLQHRAVPGSLHFETPNPHIPFAELNIEVVRGVQPLGDGERHVIGVNSFGFGGANGHVILESAPLPRPQAPSGPPHTVPILISGRNEGALRESAGRLSAWIREHEDADLYSVAYSAAHHRDWLKHRAVVCADGRVQAALDLELLAQGKPPSGVATGIALERAAGPVFVFSGNGAQWAGMGRRLLEEDAVFRATLERVDEFFRRHSHESLLAMLQAQDLEQRIEATEIAQPLLFAVQAGITEMLRSQGIAPAAVLGHSVGEIAAAWASGALVLEDAVAIVFHRSELQGRTRGAGRMCAVRLSAEALRAVLNEHEFGQRIEIAAFNSPASLTVSGPAADLDSLEAALASRGQGYARLGLDYAFHSAAMDAIERDIGVALAALRPGRARVPFVSAVTGREEDGSALGAAYWWRNIREPVRFADAIQCLRERGFSVFLEIGPKPILGGYLAECLGQALRECRILPTMAPGADGSETLRKRGFELAIAGCAFELSRYFSEAARLVDLPAYAWQRERHWYEPSPGTRGLLEQEAPHPLLGSRLRGDVAEWEGRIDISRLPEYADHRVGDELMFPAAGFAELALTACAALREGDTREVEDLTIHAPLLLEPDGSKTLRLAVEGDDGRFHIRARTTSGDESWRLHASGRLPLQVARPAPVAPFARPASGDPISADAHYAALRLMGLDYGPAFRTVVRAWSEDRLVSGELAVPETATRGRADVQLAPGSLDACFQLIVHQQKPDPDGGVPLAFVPVRIDRLSLLRPGEPVAYATVRETQRGPRSAEADCVLYGADREPVALLRGVRFRALPQRESSQLVAMRARAVPRPLPGLRQAALLPPAERLTGAAFARLHGAERLEARRRYYAVVEPLIEAMLASFAQEAMKSLEGAVLVDPAAQARLRRVRRMAGDLQLPPAADIWSELIADYPDHAAEVIRLGHIGARLADAVRGGAGIEPHRPDTSELAVAVAQLAADALAALPAGERLRVRVLQPEDSNLGIQIAARLDADHADWRVGSGPADADEAALPYDLVVLEADAHDDPTQALERARSLTMPFGLLIVLVPVPCRSSLLAESIFGDADSEEAVSTGSGAQMRARWRACVTPGGFTEEALFEDVPGSSAGPFALVMRAGPGAERDLQAQPPVQAPGTWLIAPANAPQSSQFAEKLRAELLRRGVHVITALATLPGAAPRWQEIIEQAQITGGGIAGIVELPLPEGGDHRAIAPHALVDRQLARCESLGGLFEAASALGVGAPIWVVTSRAASALLPLQARGPSAEDAAVRGWVRSAANEYPGLALHTADLADADDEEGMAGALADTLLCPDGEDEVMLAPAGRFVPRVEAMPLSRLRASRPANARETIALEIPAPGQLKNLSWVRRPLRALDDDEVEIEVRAAGLNFRDVMYAMGQLSEEALESGYAGITLGMEHAGVVAAVGKSVSTFAPGDRVFAFAGASFGTRVLARAGFAMKMPESWSFEAAATVPAAFLTAHYALNHLAHLQEGERVLIHGAAGGVGMAAIQLARNAGAEIFATAGSEIKRDAVRLLGADHVLDSRSLDFADEILARTEGRGVDVVLNSLAGEAMLRSLQVVRPLGRFLELGKRDFYENSRVGLRPFRNNLSYFGIDLDQLIRERAAFARRLMRDLVAQFEEGALSPLPYRAFAAANAESAFRHMQQSRHIGKIVLRMDPPPRVDREAPAAGARLRLPANATYLVTGGLSGFGLRTAQWLADRGARHLVLIGRSAPRPEAAEALAQLEAAGVRVRAESCDVASRAALQQVLEAIRETMPPLRGIVHAAGVFRDGVLRNLDRARNEEVFAPKIVGALNLHRLTLGAALDFFVLYSSATTTFGNPGQANYVAANMFLEALTDIRRAQRLPALCVAFGPIADAGYLERNPEIREQIAARMGDSAVTAAQALDALERLIAEDLSGLAVMKIARASLGRLAKASRAARFRDLVALVGEAASSAVETGEIDRWLEELDDAALAAMLADLLRREAAEVLRLPADRIDPAQPLQELGFDSLMGVELITAVEARFGVSIPVVAVSEIGTLEKLAMRIAQKLRRDRQGATAPQDALDAQASRLAAVHNRDMDSRDVLTITTTVRTADGGTPPPAARETP